MGHDLQNGLWIIAALTVGTLLTRFLPFVLFPDGKRQPRYIAFLGKTLPYASMGLLVVYCLKGVEWTASPFGLPESVTILFVAALHHWKHNVLLSIGGGTALYMLLVQAVIPRLPI